MVLTASRITSVWARLRLTRMYYIHNMPYSAIRVHMPRQAERRRHIRRYNQRHMAIRPASRVVMNQTLAHVTFTRGDL